MAASGLVIAFVVRISLIGGLVLGGTVLAFGQTFSAADQPALSASRAAEGMLLDVTRAGERLVAVGAQGVIVVSDSQGHAWTQREAPVSSPLTAVAFADARRGWAVGHAGVVLRSLDGGDSWQRVTIAVAAVVPADSSFLDVLAWGPDLVLAAGAYGLLVTTSDAGATWTKLAPPAEDLHLNRLTRGRDGAIYAAGEAGLLAVSRDVGATWSILDSPYQVSWYGLHELGSGRLLAHGLRGHVYTSDDGGGAWTPVSVKPAVLLMAAGEPRPGRVVLAGLGGHVFVSRDDGATFAHVQPPGLTGVAELVAAGDGALLAVGETGAHRVDLP